MKKYLRTFHWFPRILCIVAILFISLFALDAATPGMTIWQQFGAYFIHLIPSFILLVLLLIAWKWEYVGGIIFVLIGLGMSPLIFMTNYKHNQNIAASIGIILMITFPFIVTGILFIISHFMKKKAAINKD
jgi:hypothetical protein